MVEFITYIGIDIDIGRKEFAPGDKTYDRVMWCFKDRVPPLELLVVLYRDGNCTKIEFPTSVTDVKCLKSKKNVRSLTAATPELSMDDPSNPTFHSDGNINSLTAPSEQEAVMQEFLQWSGFVSCDTVK